MLVAAVLLAPSISGARNGRLEGSPLPPRDQTLYTSGGSAGPPTNFNPLSSSAYTGSQGLLYEPLFLYDPIGGSLVPWLASSGSWASATSYRLVVRDGVQWVSSATGLATGRAGRQRTSRIPSNSPSRTVPTPTTSTSPAPLCQCCGRHLTVNFAKPVGYAQWQEFLWHSPSYRRRYGQTACRDRGELPRHSPVATGPMLLYSTSGSTKPVT